jgi:membrane protein DedA with SNARE-associated domain
MLASISDAILSLHGWVALAIVFLIPALEASAFVGFIFPGEIAVLLGGVLAYQGRISLWAAVGAAVLGATVGDTIGYAVGRRWGRGLLHRTLGRLPIIRHHLERNLDRAQAFVRRRRGSAVLVGRFTAALRALIPGLAGMSGVHYPTFLAYNVAGAIAWGGGFSLLGYLAGASYRRVESYAGRIGLGLLGLVVAWLLATWAIRWLGRRSDRIREVSARLAEIPPLQWLRSRLAPQLGWIRRRLDPASPRGFALSLTVALGAFAAWSFGGLTQDVLGNDEMALFDPRFEAFVLAHRTGWLTAAMKGLTWLGSTVVIVPIAILIGAYFVVRRRDWRPYALLAGAIAGAVAWYDVVKGGVGRARPPMTDWIGRYSGHAFPSGHAAQTIAFYAMAATLLSAGRSVRTRTLLWLSTSVITLIVGFSRVYLGALAHRRARRVRPWSDLGLRPCRDLAAEATRQAGERGGVEARRPVRLGRRRANRCLSPTRSSAAADLRSLRQIVPITRRAGIAKPRPSAGCCEARRGRPRARVRQSGRGPTEPTHL